MLEAFIEAQAEQKQCNVELSIFEDVYLVLWFKIREIWEWWPSKRRIIYLLSNEVASKNVAWWQLVHLNDVPFEISPLQARSIFQTYYGRQDENTREPVDLDGW